MPKVSVLINTFKRPVLVEKAIRSVLEQDEPDFELLVLDNSSPDNTGEIVKSFNDPRVRYIRHEPLGIAVARNLAVREAKSEFVAFVDDDDMWLPNKIRVQLEVFKNSGPDVALVYGGFQWFDDSGKILHTHHPQLRGSILEDLLWQKDPFTASASNPMMRRSVILELGGYNERKDFSGEDWEFYLRLAERYRIECTPEVVVKIRQHAGPRLSTNNHRGAATLELMVMDRFKEIFERNGKLRSYYLQKIGGKYVRAGDLQEGRRYLRRAAFTKGVNTVALGQIALSFMGQGIYHRAHRAYQSARKNKV